MELVVVGGSVELVVVVGTAVTDEECSGEVVELTIVEVEDGTGVSVEVEMCGDEGVRVLVIVVVVTDLVCIYVLPNKKHAFHLPLEAPWRWRESVEAV